MSVSPEDTREARVAPTARKAFKEYFDEEAALRLGGQVKRVWPGFDDEAFFHQATADIHSKEFSARVKGFADALAATLPADVPRALELLTRSLPPAWLTCEAMTDGWLQWPVGQYIADYGLADVEASMEAMIALRMRFSSEFAIRPFLIQCPDFVYPKLYALTGHENPHVRRWCSEGSRPRLPWGKALPAVIADPTPSWPILEALKDDPELYVRRSVANHVNDIAKDHPEDVIEHCRGWWKKAPPGRAWMIRHGLRSLVKTGHPRALTLLGYAPEVALRGALRVEPKRIGLGDVVTMNARVENPDGPNCRAVVDYEVEFARPSGLVSRKVFKWTTLEVPAGGVVTLIKKHAFRTTSIRAIHPGLHRITLQVNGRASGDASLIVK